MSRVPKDFDAENAENLQEIEKQFAVVAVEHAETYWSLLEKFGGANLKLTPIDNEIYDDFVATFPEYLENPDKVRLVNEDEIKNKVNKKKWFDFAARYEKKVPDFNFGALLRLDSSKEYTQENTCFSFRVQFDAFEIFRNRHGLNDWIKK
ncbi:hypothetical protein DASB73_019240 [Starmerella bacillaris]|uniref:Polysaccharide biosynthesis domain-containing protein n=1 Tax=Starmerella bacillaris TaxID=1247836 RepID=A0AAV5RK23_STABA|nr:hypothetical protein DASB73_019240 [Starmerella bacillaris]